MTIDITEGGLERLICEALTGEGCEPSGAGSTGGEGVADTVASDAIASAGLGWICGSPSDYDKEFCLDLEQLASFLQATQPKTTAALPSLSADSPARRELLARIGSEIDKRGTVDVLRNGISHRQHNIELYFPTPSAGNPKAAGLFDANRFSVTRQLRYSRANTGFALDIALFVNGLPVATFELKNSLTKQTVHDAVRQYQNDRDSREKLFAKGRCLAHFALDDSEAMFCTHLQGKKSVFLPFNKGVDDGAGNPPNLDGIKTDYLWREVLARRSFADILENYAQSGIWPRYHQVDVVRRLLADAQNNGVGEKYLIQHSAGSGKSFSIAWLAHRLIDLRHEDKPMFDTIIVVTDRVILDRQINQTIKQFTQVRATVGHADRSGDLRKFIAEGKKIVITTIQKFPFILEEIGDEHRGRNFAIIIDEAHSSQGGRTAAAMGKALAGRGDGADETDGSEIDGRDIGDNSDIDSNQHGGLDENPDDNSSNTSDLALTFEDQINKIMDARKPLANASYFAFTATPKNKTLEIFGKPAPQPDGKIRHLSFHSYTMKQAIQEGFILDVLANYTPVKSYYLLAKVVSDDPEYDAKKAQKKLRRYVESHEHAIRLKAEIMVDHFAEQVLNARKIGGKARAMVVTDGVERAIKYYHAISDYLRSTNSRCRAIIAFSGEHTYGNQQVTEASLNGFSSSQIAKKIQDDPYRILVCADKFQTGYDEPLLHTMYVDKTLSGVKAVQTLSRLNRAHPQKSDVFVLDFMNDTDTIKEAFEPYYRATVLAEETDPNKLHDLQADLDKSEVYLPEEIDELVKRYLEGSEQDRPQLDPLLDTCVERYRHDLGEDAQVNFKGKAKAFVRTYEFLASVLPYSNEDWEKRSIFLRFLVPKLPAPQEDDLSQGILQAIDMDSYRVERRTAMKLALPDEHGEIAPVPTEAGGAKPEAEMERLSHIIAEFNNLFGNIVWDDQDRVQEMLTDYIPNRVAKDEKYANARQHSDRQNAQVEHNRALEKVMTAIMEDESQLFKLFTDNETFKAWLQETVFKATYDNPSLFLG